MPLVKNIEEKIKINKAVSLAVIAAAVVTVIATLVFCFSVISDSRKSLYVLDNGVPVLVKQTDDLMNRPLEYKSQVEFFHRLFFTLAPDDQYIKENIGKALYLIDDSGKKEYNNLKEKGFYNQLVSSNTVTTIHADSIKMDIPNKKFVYYGVQTLNRRTVLIRRKLISEGRFQDIPRTPNNPHGVLLTNWRILDNTEIYNQPKTAF